MTSQERGIRRGKIGEHGFNCWVSHDYNFNMYSVNSNFSILNNNHYEENIQNNINLSFTYNRVFETPMYLNILYSNLSLGKAINENVLFNVDFTPFGYQFKNYFLNESIGFFEYGIYIDLTYFMQLQGKNITKERINFSSVELGFIFESYINVVSIPIDYKIKNSLISLNKSNNILIEEYNQSLIENFRELNKNLNLNFINNFLHTNLEIYLSKIKNVYVYYELDYYYYKDKNIIRKLDNGLKFYW